MSYAILHGFDKNGEIFSYAEYKNAWHGSILVWISIAEKYGIPNGEAVVHDNVVAQKIWNLAGEERVALHDRITLLSTFDRKVVYAKDFPRLVAAMKESAKWLPSHCHIGKQADDIERIIVEHPDTIAVAWTGTSVADCWGSGEYRYEEDINGQSCEDEVPYNLNRHVKHKDMFEGLKDIVREVPPY